MSLPTMGSLSTNPRARDFSLLIGWVVCVCVTFVLMGCHDKPHVRIAAEEGVLDLRQVDLAQVLSLNGEWLAYAGSDSAVFAEFDYDDSHWQPVSVEGYFQDQGFPSEGLVWYRLHLKLPPDAPLLWGYIQHANNAHALYVAKPGQAAVEATSSGHPAAMAEETIRSRSPATFRVAPDTSLVLTWKVANYGYKDGGPFHAIQLGQSDVVTRYLLFKISFVFVSLGIYFLLALSLFFNWFWRRDARVLAVSLIAATMAIRVVTASGMLDWVLGDLLIFDLRIRLEGTVVVLPGLIGYLLWSFFPNEFLTGAMGRWKVGPPQRMEALERELSGPLQSLLPRQVRGANTAFVLVAMLSSAIFLVGVLVGTPQVTSHILSAWRWLTLAFLPYCLVFVFIVLQRKRPLAQMLAFGLVPVLGSGLYDLLMAEGLIPGTFYLSEFGLLFFLGTQGYAVARRAAQYAELARFHTEKLEQEVDRRTQALQKATVAAQAASIAKSQFVSAVSHELRTPLAAILGFAQVLEDELHVALEPAHREFFQAMHSSGKRLLKLIDDLLDVAKIEAGKLDLDIRPVLVRDLVDDVMVQMQPLATYMPLRLLVPRVTPDHMQVYADETRLRQVLINLVSNAIKFTEQGHVGLAVEQTTFQGQAACAFSVFDTGVGIAPDFLSELFQPFTQEQRAYQQTQSGTGLGLAITYELVKRMNGTIEVQTTVGDGSTFTVILPCVVPGAIDRSPRPSSVTPSRRAMHGLEARRN